MTVRRFLLALLLALPLTRARADMPDLAPVRRWIARQDEIKTVEADFTQTRSFKALRDPLAAPGRLWFSAPTSFRWELGSPPKTIFLRQGPTSYVVEPAKKQAERMSDTGMGQQASGRGLPMMEFPLAKSFDDFNRKFEVLGAQVAAGVCHLDLLPRDPQMRKVLSAMHLEFNVETGALVSFEFVTRDGSSLRNDFSNVRFNQKIDPHVFDYDFTGYEVVDAK